MPLLKSIILSLVLLFGQEYTINDSTKVDKKSQTEKIERLSVKVDSLERVLRSHNLKESFFTSSLSIQTGLFSLIVLGLLSLATLANWFFIYRKLKAYIDDKIKEVNTKFEKLADRFEVHRLNTWDTSRKLFDILEHSEDDPMRRNLLAFNSIISTNDLLSKFDLEDDELNKEVYYNALSTHKSSLRTLYETVDQIDNEYFLENVLPNVISVVEESKDLQNEEVAEISRNLLGKLYGLNNQNGDNEEE